MSVGLGVPSRVLTEQLLKSRTPDIVGAERAAAYQATNLLTPILPGEVGHAKAVLVEPRVQRGLGLTQSHVLNNGHPILFVKQIQGPYATLPPN